jgi:putative phosphoribosyl transferase
MNTPRDVQIALDHVRLEGTIGLPEAPTGLVLFAHGSGSSRLSPRNNFVASELRAAGLATLLLDLLTPEEDRDYELRFDIDLLTTRLVAAARWAMAQPSTRALPIGLFGASTGAAAALQAAADLAGGVAAVVSRGGRPDLAGDALARVRAPTLLIVGGSDEPVIALNREAYAKIQAEKDLVIVPGASHLFEESGALEQVARLATQWFRRHIAGDGQSSGRAEGPTGP